MTDKDTPLKLVRLWDRRYSGAYDWLDRMCSQKGEEGVSWPDWCKIPISAALTLLVEIFDEDSWIAAASASEITACWTWRQNKIIFVFDKDLGEVLIAQAEDVRDTDVLPVNLLMRLPYSCFYIKYPYLLKGFDGFFVCLEYDMSSKKAELRLQLVNDHFDHSIPLLLHLLPDATIRDCIRDTEAEATKNAGFNIEFPQELRHLLMMSIQMILYLVADNAEIAETKPRKRNPQNLQRKTSDKFSDVSVSDVGLRIGAQIRAVKRKYELNQQPSTGGKKRPHTRRGHWHHYWTGPRNSESRRLILKWTAPTVIHPDNPDRHDGIAIYPVK